MEPTRVEKAADCETVNEMSTLQMICTTVNTKISDSLEGLGRRIARHPYLVITLSVIFATVWGTVFFRFSVENRRIETLYTPKNAQSVRDKEYALAKFGQPPQEIRVLITRDVDLPHGMDCNKRSLLLNSTQAKGILLDFMNLYELIQSRSIEYDGKSYSLLDVCEKPDGETGNCKIQSVLDVWNYDRNALEADADVLETIQRAFESGTARSQTSTPIVPSFVAGVAMSGSVCEGRVEALQLSICLENDKVDIDGKLEDPESTLWSFELVETVTKKWHNQNSLVGHVSSFEGIGYEADKSIKRDLSKFTIGYIFVFLFAICVLYKNNSAACKSHLALISILSIVMAVVTAFGIAALAGVEINFVVKALPFILLGLGIDDTFVIMGAYHSTSMDLSVEDRIAQTMSRAGSSILVTSITDMMVFLVGTYTDLPAMKAFSIYAFLGIAFDFIYQVTFFTAFVVLDAQREKRAMQGVGFGGLSCCSNRADTKSEATTKEIEVQDVEKGPTIPSTKNTAAAYQWRRRLIGWGNYDPDATSTATRIVGEWLPSITLTSFGSTVVLLIEAVLITAAIYGCTKVKMDLRYREWFVPKDSYLSESLKIERMYFLGPQDPFVVISKEPVDGRDFYFHQDEYLALVNAVRNADYVASVPPVTSWYESFSEWLSNESPFKKYLDKDSQHAPNATAFYEWLHLYLDDPAGKVFKDHVVFGEDGIISARFTAFTKEIKDGSFAVATVENIRNTAGAAAPVFGPIAYTLTFLFYDGFKVISCETVRNVVMAGVVVFVILAAVLANIQVACIVTVMIVLTDIMLFGFMWYAGLTLNLVTSICMVVSIGLAVDYSAHIAHSFLVLDGSRNDRAKGALRHIGGEVCAGAFTTWLAIAAMGVAEHYISRVFFKMFFAIVVTGVWHGIVVLPVILSAVGPVVLHPERSRGTSSEKS